MRAFALAAAACLGIAGQAEAITYYGSLDGRTKIPNENEPQSGADIKFWSDDGWNTVYITVRSVGRFSHAEFNFGKAGDFEYGILGWPGRGESTDQFLAPDWINVSVGGLARNVKLTYWCWFGCEYGGSPEGGGKYAWIDYTEVLTPIADGKDQVRFVLGALVPDVLPAPVPLPAAAPLLLAGTAALFGLRRRR